MNKPLQDNELRTYPSGAARICAAVLVVAPDMDAVICRGPAPAEPARILRGDDESDVVDDYGRPLAPSREYGAEVARRAGEQMAAIRSRVLGPAPRYGEDDPYDRMGYRAQAAFDAEQRDVFSLMAERGPGRTDARPHHSIQAWSRGPIFPAVIAQIERREVFPDYNTWLDTNGRRQAPAGTFPRGSYQHWQEERAAHYAQDFIPSVSHELTIGAFREEYATYADAEEVARWCCADGRIIPERYAELMDADRAPAVHAELLGRA